MYIKNGRYYFKLEFFLSLLMIYFTTKLLWDKIVPNFFELLSFVLMGVGVISFFVLKKFKGHLISIYMVIYALYVVYILLNAYSFDNPAQFQRAIYEYIAYSLVFFSCVGLLNDFSLEKCCVWFGKIGLIIALLSWYEFLTKSYLIANLSQTVAFMNYSGFRSSVFTRSFLSHGVILGIFSIANAYAYISKKQIRYLLFALFCYISIFTTSSRGPLVACGIALVWMYILNAFVSKKHSRKRFLAVSFVLVSCAVVVFILTSTFTVTNQSVNYFLYRLRSTLNWNGDAGNVGRIEFWEKAIRLFDTNRTFGIGASKTGSWGVASIGVTESGVLKRLCELGVVGFTIHYMLFVMIIGYAVKKYQMLSNTGKKRMLFYGSILILILIDDITLQVTEEIMISFFMWFSLAGIYVTARYSDSKKAIFNSEVPY